MICRAVVDEPPYYLHSHLCGRPAKGMKLMVMRSGARREFPACGIHLRLKRDPWLYEDQS